MRDESVKPCDHVYSRVIDREYPRKCMKCGEREPVPADVPSTRRDMSLDIKRAYAEFLIQQGREPTALLISHEHMIGLMHLPNVAHLFPLRTPSKSLPTHFMGMRVYYIDDIEWPEVAATVSITAYEYSESSRHQP